MGVLALFANFVRFIYFHRFEIRSVDIWAFVTSYVPVDMMRGIFYALFLFLMLSHERVLSRWRGEIEEGLNRLDTRLLQLDLDMQLRKVSGNAT
jgi:hypothetical protein